MVSEVLRPVTVAAAAADGIRDAIFRGTLCMGAPLREVELSQSLRVSRGTVRDAFQILQAEGLVEIFMHRGAFVTTLTQRTVGEVYSLRAMLEPSAVRMAVRNGSYGQADIAQLELLMQRLLEQKGDIFYRSEADVQFHYQLCSPSDHQLLLQVLRNLRSLTRLCILNCDHFESGLLSDKSYHRDVLEAILRNEADQAADVLRLHIEHSRATLLEVLVPSATGLPS